MSVELVIDLKRQHNKIIILNADKSDYGYIIYAVETMIYLLQEANERGEDTEKNSQLLNRYLELYSLLSDGKIDNKGKDFKTLKDTLCVGSANIF